MKIITLLLLFLLTLFANDITMQGYLHPGDNQSDSYTPPDPLTLDDENTYDYYTDNPTRFYLSEDTTITKVTLENAQGINGKLHVYIDDTLVASSSNDGDNSVDIDNLDLGKGYHTIAVTGDCYRWSGRVTDCSSRQVRDIDDYYFDAITLTSQQESIAVHYIGRHHIGDNNDNDNNYNINDDDNQWYPDNYENSSYAYDIGNSDELYGFKIFISRMRDIDQNGVSTVEVYNQNDNLIQSFDINHSDTGVFDYTIRYDENVSGVKKIRIKSGKFSNGSYDDISFDELIFIPFYSANYSDINEPLIEYRMDECSWDSNTNTYEVKNSGSAGNDANATALNDANTSDGLLCKAGDFNAKYIQLKTNQNITTTWTNTFWVHFPLIGSDNQIEINLGSRRGNNAHYYKGYVIASVDGDGDLGLFLKDDDGDYRFGVYDNNTDFDTIDIPDLSDGWHFFTMRSDGDKTELFIDADETSYTINLSTSGELTVVGTSTDSSDDETVGAMMDEFKIFTTLLTQDQISTIYNNEKNSKNYDGTTRSCPNCSGGTENQAYKFDAWDTFRDINDRNISTKIVARDFNLTIASLNEAGDDYQEFNGTVCAKIDTNETKLDFRDQNSSTATFQLDHALSEIRVLLRWWRNKDVNCDANDEDNSTNSTDNFAIRPKTFAFNLPTGSAIAAKDFNITFYAYDDAGTNTQEYNQSIGNSFDVNTTETKEGCFNDTLDYNESSWSFANGTKALQAHYNEVGKITINIHEINGSEFAHVDADDTDDAQRLITTAEANLSIVPDHFSITATLYNHDTDNNFTYLSKDLNMSVRLGANITAQNEQNQTTKNYNTECYAQNIDINLSHSDVTSDNLTQLLFIVEDANDTNSSKDSISKNDTLTLTYPKENFTTENNGSTTISFFINFDRNASKTVTPFDMNITEIGIRDTNGTTGRQNSINNSVNFYYGRLLSDDITTSQTTASSQSSFLYYCDDASSSFIASDDTAILVNWYKKANHDTTEDGKITAALVSDTTKKSPTSTSITVSHTENNITVTNNDKISATRYIHLDITPWLWYIPANFGSSYDDTNDTSNCTQHPCIKYTFIQEGSGTQVKSGSTNALKYDTNLSKVNRGVRLLR